MNTMWATILQTLLQLASAVLTYMQSRQMLDAGKATQIAENLNASLAVLDKADKARADAYAKHDAAGGVPDSNDKYRRD